MNISFRNKKLKKYAENKSLCKKNLGDLRSRLFIMRIVSLAAAKNLESVRHLPGHYHELTGNRKGQWACDLDHPYRLVFEPHESPVPADSDGKYIWIEIKGVEIIGIENYHGK